MSARKVTLARHIVGAPTLADFRIEDDAPAVLAEGQALARVILASVDPGTRSRLSPGASYAAPLAPGDVIDGFCVGQILESRNPRLTAGALAAFGAGWRERAVLDGRGFLQAIPDRRLPLSAWIGALGVPGMTAYFGLTRVAALKAGDSVLITSAAGPVGATAGQIARRLGAGRVVGVAGGAAKCAWLVGEAGFDAAIDYKAEADLPAAVRAALPKGVDVLFDNVGGAMLDSLIPNMRRFGRIVISGQVAEYNADPATTTGLKATRWFIANRLRMEGIVVFDDLKSFPEAQARVADWILTDGLVYREELFEGIEALPAAFCGLFTGDSFGRRIVRLGPDPA